MLRLSWTHRILYQHPSPFCTAPPPIFQPSPSLWPGISRGEFQHLEPFGRPESWGKKFFTTIQMYGMYLVIRAWYNSHDPSYLFKSKLEMSILKGRCQNPKRTDSVESSLTALITSDTTYICISPWCVAFFLQIHNSQLSKGISPDFTIPFAGGVIYPPWNDVPPSQFWANHWELAAKLASVDLQYTAGKPSVVRGIVYLQTVQPVICSMALLFPNNKTENHPLQNAAALQSPPAPGDFKASKMPSAIWGA